MRPDSGWKENFWRHFLVLPSISAELPMCKKFCTLSDYGILELENNAAELGMDAIALGRKNYLFVYSEAGGKTAAIAYTLIETAKLNAIDPHA
jgi:hypothetical protein